jgi:hypothetical protein
MGSSNLLDDGFLVIVSEKADGIIMNIWGRKLHGKYRLTPSKDNATEKTPNGRVYGVYFLLPDRHRKSTEIGHAMKNMRYSSV